MGLRADDEIAALLDLSYLSDDGKLRHLLSVLPTLHTLDQLSELCDQLADLNEFDSSVILSNFSGMIDECKWSCMCVAMIGKITRENQIQVFNKISRVVRLLRKITMSPMMIDTVLKNTITHVCQVGNVAPVVRNVLQDMFTGGPNGEGWSGVLVANKRIIQHCFEVWMLACTQQEQWHMLLALLSLTPPSCHVFRMDVVDWKNPPEWLTEKFLKARAEWSLENCSSLRIPWVSILSLCHHLLDIGHHETFLMLLPLLLAKACSTELLVDRLWHRNLFEEKSLDCNEDNCVCHNRHSLDDIIPSYNGIGVARSYQVLIRLDMLRNAGKIDTFSECPGGYGLDTLILRYIAHANQSTREYVDYWLEDLEQPLATPQEALRILTQILQMPECQVAAYQFLELCCRLAETYFVCDQGRLGNLITSLEQTPDVQLEPSGISKDDLQKNFELFSGKSDCSLREYVLLSVLETYESKCGVPSNIPYLNAIDVMVAPKALNLSDNLCESLLLSYYLQKPTPIALHPTARLKLSATQGEDNQFEDGVTPTLLPINIARIWRGYLISSSFKKSLLGNVSISHFDRWRTVMLELLVASCKGTYSPSNTIAPHLSDSLVDNFVRVYVSQNSKRAMHLSRRYIGRQSNKITKHIVNEAIKAQNFAYIAQMWMSSDIMNQPADFNTLLVFLSQHIATDALAETVYVELLASANTTVHSPLLLCDEDKLLGLKVQSTPATETCDSPSSTVSGRDIERLSPSKTHPLLHRLNELTRQRPIHWTDVDNLLFSFEHQPDALWASQAYCIVLTNGLQLRDYAHVLRIFEYGVTRYALNIETCAQLLQQVHFLNKARMQSRRTQSKSSNSSNDMEGIDDDKQLREQLIGLARKLDPTFNDCHLLSAVVEALSKAREFDRILSVVSDFVASHPKPTPLALAVVVKAYGRCGKKEEVLKLWPSVSGNSRDEFIHGCLIDALVFIGELDEALAAWQSCMKTGIRLGELCQSVLIRGCVTRNRFNEAMKVYRSMVDRAIFPCDITCNYLMHGCAQLGRLDDALQCFEEMRQWSTPDIVSYSTIIKGLCDKHKVEMAYNKFFLKMESVAGLEPDIVTYNTLLEGFSKVGCKEKVDKLYKELIDRGLKPTCYTLTILIKFYGKLKMLNKVFEVFQELPQKYNFECDQFVYTSLIAACTWQKRLDLAYNVLVSMREKFSVSTRTYSTVIAGCIKIHAWDTLADILYLCIQDEVSLNKKDLNKLESVLKMNTRADKPSKGKKVAKQDAESAVDPDVPPTDSGKIAVDGNFLLVSQIRLFHTLLFTLRESSGNWSSA